MKHIVSLVLACFLLLTTFFNCDLPYTEIVKVGTSFNKDINKYNWLYFRLKVSDVIPNFSNNDVLSFMLTPISGDVDLYIKSSNFPVDPNCDDCWKSTGPSGDVVQVRKTDPMWPVGDEPVLYIGVYAPETMSKFTLNTYLKDKSEMMLYTSVPQTGYADRGEWVYFSYELVGSHDFTISCTPIQGDPDVFVSKTNNRPSPEDSDWSSAGYRVEWIDIKTTDPKFQADTTYYIGVRAWTTTYFSLLAGMPDQYDLLLEGTPSSGVVDKEAYNYYEFILRDTSTPNLIFQLNSLLTQSDADIYIVYGSPDPKPSREHWDWHSIRTGVDMIEIKNAQAGSYYIAIYGFHDSTYQLTGYTERTTLQLTDGISQEGFATPNVWKYYKYYHPDPDAGVTISVIPKNVWPDPTDLTFYTGLGTNTKPTDQPGKYWRKADAMGYDSILTVAAPTPTGNYYFGLISQFSTNFTISVKTNQSYTVLQDGVTSFWNHVPEGSYRYFVFDDPKPSLDTTVTILPQGGDADLFMSQDEPYPQVGRATWSSTSWGDNPDYITVRHDDEKRKQVPRFYIGVRGLRDTYFSIIAYSSDQTIELRDGVSISGTVDVAGYVYYKLPIPSRGAITVTLQLQDSEGNYDADLYASTRNEKPNKDVHDYKSTKIGNDVITTPAIGPGYLYIGVLGVKAPKGQVAFTIQGSQDYTQVPLNYGSVFGMAKPGKVKNFVAYIPMKRGAVIPSVSMINGRSILYASSNATEQAGPNHYDWMVEDWPHNTMAIPSSDPKFKTGQWTFGVMALQPSEFYVSITLSSEIYQAFMTLDIPMSGVAAHMFPAYYKYKIPYEDGGKVSEDYFLDIRMFGGETEMFIDQSYSILPNPHNYTFTSRSKGSRILTLNKEKLKQGYMFIAVFGVSFQEENKFTITLTKGYNPRILPQDLPTDLEVKFRDYSFFKVLNTHGGYLNMWIDSCDTANAPTIYADAEFDHPTQQRYTFISSIEAHGYSAHLSRDVGEDALTYTGITSVYSPVKSRIYMTTSLDARPIIANRALAGTRNFRGDLILKFGRAHRNVLQDIPVSYSVYIKEVEYIRGKPAEVNIYTPCAVEKTMKLIGTQTPDSSVASDYITYVLNTLDFGKKYRLQVVAKDKYDLATAYTPAWIINGEVVDGDYNDYPVGISLIFILVLFFGSIMYCFFGFIINIVRGKRGWEIIPHSQFWIDIPLLWFDGIRFIISCGGLLKFSALTAKTDKYKEFRDENENSVNAPIDDFKPNKSNIIVEREDEEESEGAIVKPGSQGYGTV